MGYKVYLHKFENGDSASIPYDELLGILQKYGEVVERGFGLEFISQVGDIADSVSLTGNADTGITGITFERPVSNPRFPEIIYELLGLPNTCFFGPNLEFMHTRSEMNEHYPQGLIEHLRDGPKKIASPAEAWLHT